MSVKSHQRKTITITIRVTTLPIKTDVKGLITSNNTEVKFSSITTSFMRSMNSMEFLTL